MLGQSLYAVRIQCIGSTLLAVGRHKLELVSVTHELNAVGFQFLFQPTPVMSSLLVVRLVIDGSHNICSLEPPLAVLLVPNGPCSRTLCHRETLAHIGNGIPVMPVEQFVSPVVRVLVWQSSCLLHLALVLSYLGRWLFLQAQNHH